MTTIPQLALWALTLACAVSAGPALAGDADVVGVRTRQSAVGVYDFDVTVRSRDTGWMRYADRLEAVAPDGAVLGTRVLDHPHDDEQPFTRDLYGVRIPTATTITIRAHFKPSGFDGTVATVKLPGDAR